MKFIELIFFIGSDIYLINLGQIRTNMLKEIDVIFDFGLNNIGTTHVSISFIKITWKPKIPKDFDT